MSFLMQTPTQMITVSFIQPDGQCRSIAVRAGQSLMLAAVESNVQGIRADCGGCMVCATCHVYLEVSGSIAAPAADELEMLDCVADERRPTSRLSCQVVMEPALDGAVVTIPARQ